jgi:hypothetical protein
MLRTNWASGEIFKQDDAQLVYQAAVQVVALHQLEPRPIPSYLDFGWFKYDFWRAIVMIIEDATINRRKPFAAMIPTMPPGCVFMPAHINTICANLNALLQQKGG